jgi:prevent-host-death family protein
MSVVARISVTPEPASGGLPEAIARAERGEGRVVLTRDGTPVAAVVPISDLQALEEQEAEDGDWSTVADEAIARWEAAGRPEGISHEELLARYGITPDGE